MVCIAAFIILGVVGIFVAIISIFKPSVWKKYKKLMKKSAGCLGKKVRLQKCETGFKEDVKNSMLSRVLVKHPKWVTPLSWLIEILSVVFVIVVVWAILTSVKSLLALWALGSCNVTKPSACTMGAEMCSIDESEPQNPAESIGRWFEEWGEIFSAIPDKFRTYKAEDYLLNYITIDDAGSTSGKPAALDILDPLCIVCMNSYRNQKSDGFFERYDVRLVPFAIQDADNKYKFENSEIIVRYIFAAEQYRGGEGVKILDRIFTGTDGDGISWQSVFQDDFSREEAAAQLEEWLREDDFPSDGIKQVAATAMDESTTRKMQENREIVEKQIKVKGIPTEIYDGAKHTGLYKINSK
ncbi:hypothetical protein IKE72_02835 [Candidatus Saccharibacteria bacterium]|nr:hypothetical protein [Candidatus Saccharibacteria bacterium]